LLIVLCLTACHSTSKAERLDEQGRHEKRPARAVDDLTQAIELEPTRADFWLHRGDARARGEDQDGAIADFTQSITLAPTGTAYLHRARARRKKLLLDLALVDLDKAGELDPELATTVESERERVEAARTGKPSKE
jgi:tetratricopeptide (TPR) repeat protein